MGSTRPWAMLCLWLGVVAHSLNAQGDVASSRPDVPAPVPSWNRPHHAGGLLQSLATGAGIGHDQVGPIGHDRQIDYSCTFYSNASYSCKTDCGDDSETETKEFPDRPHLKYTEFNCSTDLPTKGSKWSKDNGIIHRLFDPALPSEIVATCAFYRTHWFECFGVADCGQGEGITHCAGGAPWRGFYSGSPAEGLHGNRTHEAMNSPGRNAGPKTAPVFDTTPLPGATAPDQVSSGHAQKLLYSCEKFVDTDASCYTFEKQCRKAAGRTNSCRTIRRPYIRNTNSESVFAKFDDVVNSITPQSLAQAKEIIVVCYVYSNREFLCSFPFPVELSRSSSLVQSTGSYYRSTF